MMYALLRSFCRFLLFIFYREITVSGVADPGGPLILVANHPSTLNDALLIACRLNRQVSIIAKASLFENPVAGWILKSFGGLPVVRRGFEAKGDSTGQSNDDTFQAIYDCLAGNGVILIFPEGTSHLEPTLHKIKTGAARMALGAEERYGPLGVQIVPVGLNYEDPRAFGMDVRVRFGEPIPASPFLEEFKGDVHAAGRRMTSLIEAQLHNEMVHLDNPEFQDVLMSIHRWIGDKFVEEGRHKLDVLRKIAKIINHFNEVDEERVKQFQASIKEYYNHLEENKLNDAALDDPQAISGMTIFAGILIFPFWLYGTVNHYIPYQIPRICTSLLKIDPVYDSTVKLFTGVFSFSLMYALQSALVWYFTSIPVAAIYLITLPISGMIALQCLQTFYELKTRRENNAVLAKADSAAVLKALKIRGELLEQLSHAEQEFFNTQTNDQSSNLIKNAIDKSLQAGVSGRLEWRETTQEEPSD